MSNLENAQKKVKKDPRRKMKASSFCTVSKVYVGVPCLEFKKKSRLTDDTYRFFSLVLKFHKNITVNKLHDRKGQILEDMGHLDVVSVCGCFRRLWTSLDVTERL